MVVYIAQNTLWQNILRKIPDSFLSVMQQFTDHECHVLCFGTSYYICSLATSSYVGGTAGLGPLQHAMKTALAK